MTTTTEKPSELLDFSNSVVIGRRLESINGRPARGDAVEAIKALGITILDQRHPKFLTVDASGWKVSGWRGLAALTKGKDRTPIVLKSFLDGTIKLTNVSPDVSNAGYISSVPFYSIIRNDDEGTIVDKLERLRDGCWLVTDTIDQFDRALEYVGQRQLSVNLRCFALKA